MTLWRYSAMFCYCFVFVLFALLRRDSLHRDCHTHVQRAWIIIHTPTPAQKKLAAQDVSCYLICVHLIIVNVFVVLLMLVFVR